MKYLYLLTLLCLLTIGTSAQNLSNSADLSILEKKWGASSVSITTPSDLAFINGESGLKNADQMIREQKADYRINQARQRERLPLETPNPASKSPKNYDYGRNGERSKAISYNYQIKVQNNGNKIIKKVVWEYVFLDPNTQQEVGRRRVESETNLKPQGKDYLSGKLFSPPSDTINVKNAGKKSSEQFIEQVNIKTIEYSDGSVWKAN